MHLGGILQQWHCQCFLAIFFSTEGALRPPPCPIHQDLRSMDPYGRAGPQTPVCPRSGSAGHFVCVFLLFCTDVSDLHKLFANVAINVQHCPNVRLMPNCLFLKLPNHIKLFCVAAAFRKLQTVHVSTEHKQEGWTKWPVLHLTLLFIRSAVNKFNCQGFQRYKLILCGCRI